MKKRLLSLLLLALACTPHLLAQDAAHDSIDVLHYTLYLDMGNHTPRTLEGRAEITFVITRPCSQVTFDLIADSIQPVSIDGVVTRGFNFDRDYHRVSVYLYGAVGDTHVVAIPYVTRGHVENYGFGGLHFDANIYYNLGAVFREYPHCYGRVLYPCRDNFYDKATYTYVVTSQPGWASLCSGALLSTTANADGSVTERWELSQPSPTYISSVSSAPWHIIQRSFDGIDSTYPATLGFLQHDSARVQRHFDMLAQVVPMFEHCFGPYRWQRIGYVSTPMGSMEHAQNIALVSQCMDDVSTLSCEMTTCHELGHAWFGNLLTCTTEGDMWINEGGASFCEEVAHEAIHGKSAATDYYQAKLASVLLTTHHTDDGYRPLHDMPLYYTYGSTTYDKGATVWHSLRGYLGDSLFYASMRRLFDVCAFGNIDAYGLRDSLSRYTGRDLTDFFDFHVFHEGFVDYLVDRMTVDGWNATVTLRQQLRGTGRHARGNRVPLTFFSHDLRQSRHLMVFDDSVATQTFALPFVAAFVVVDIDRELSDACTDAAMAIRAKGTTDLPRAFCKVRVGNTPEGGDGYVHIGHHYTRPTGPFPAGVVRTSERFWQVVGNIPWDADVQGLFLYNQGAYGGSNASYLDEGCYEQRATLDSLCLLYRPDASQPWQCVSHRRTASSNTSTGHFVSRLFPGQYAIAVADLDTLQLSPLTPSPSTQITVSPNPAGTEFRVQWTVGQKKMTLALFDTNGRKVLEKKAVESGDTIRHHLAAGTYIVVIENKSVSLQSQIVVQ